jgi:hypothetical protein
MDASRRGLVRNRWGPVEWASFQRLIPERTSSSQNPPRLARQAEDQQGNRHPQEETAAEVRKVAVRPEPQHEAEGQSQNTPGGEQIPVPSHTAS